MKRSLGALLLLSTVCLLAPGTDVRAGNPARSAARQYIFSRSSNPTSSNTLGLTGVPAYVNFPDRSQKCGTYVMSSAAGGAGLLMGLTPGTVLLNIDNQVAASPSTVDSMLSGRKSRFNYSYVKMVKGLPTVVKSYIALGGSGAPASTTSSIFAPDPPGSPRRAKDTTPLNTLESYMVDLVNQDRSRNGGLAPLSSNSRLSDLARHYAEYLLTVQGGRLSHTDQSGHDPSDRALAAGISGGVRENLAAQGLIKSGKEHVAAAEAQMMNEPDNVPNHRTNILCADCKSVGVGMARNATMLIMVQEISTTNP